MPPRIAILTGGTSSEREVALQSAQFVEHELRSYLPVKTYDFPKELEAFLQDRTSIDLVIPLFHGVGGEDGTIQGFLKTLSIPFLFSDVGALAIAMNKAVTKDLLLQHGIPTAPYSVLTKTESLPRFTGPCVIKPIDAGSSIGITIAQNETDFREGIAHGFKWSTQLLIEDYLQGREYTVAVIQEDETTIALPVVEICSKNAFFDLESKYDADLVEEICPARIEETLADKLKTIALKTHTLIGAKHLSRTDIIVDAHNEPWVLEINTIPGQTTQSLFPKAIKASGRSLGQTYLDWITKELRV